jgi:hypothetical protein
LPDNRVVFHYLTARSMPKSPRRRQPAGRQADALQARCDELVRDDEFFRAIMSIAAMHKLVRKRPVMPVLGANIFCAA